MGTGYTGDGKDPAHECWCVCCMRGHTGIHSRALRRKEYGYGDEEGISLRLGSILSGRLGFLIMRRSRSVFAKGSVGGGKDSGGDGRGAAHELEQHR